MGADDPGDPVDSGTVPVVDSPDAVMVTEVEAEWVPLSSQHPPAHLITGSQAQHPTNPSLGQDPTGQDPTNPSLGQGPAGQGPTGSLPGQGPVSLGVGDWTRLHPDVTRPDPASRLDESMPAADAGLPRFGQVGDGPALDPVGDAPWSIDGADVWDMTEGTVLDAWDAVMTTDAQNPPGIDLMDFPMDGLDANTNPYLPTDITALAAWLQDPTSPSFQEIFGIPSPPADADSDGADRSESAIQGAEPVPAPRGPGSPPGSLPGPGTDDETFRYPDGTPAMPREWAHNLDQARTVLETASSELLQHVGQLMGIHRSPSIIADDTDPTTPQNRYRALHNDIAALIALSLTNQHNPDDHNGPAWQLSQQLRDHFHTHPTPALPGGTARNSALPASPDRVLPDGMATSTTPSTSSLPTNGNQVQEVDATTTAAQRQGPPTEHTGIEGDQNGTPPLSDGAYVSDQERSGPSRLGRGRAQSEGEPVPADTGGTVTPRHDNAGPDELPDVAEEASTTSPISSRIAERDRWASALHPPDTPEYQRVLSVLRGYEQPSAHQGGTVTGTDHAAPEPETNAAGRPAQQSPDDGQQQFHAGRDHAEESARWASAVRSGDDSADEKMPANLPDDQADSPASGTDARTESAHLLGRRGLTRAGRVSTPPVGAEGLVHILRPDAQGMASEGQAWQSDLTPDPRRAAKHGAALDDGRDVADITGVTGRPGTWETLKAADRDELDRSAASESPLDPTGFIHGPGPRALEQDDTTPTSEPAAKRRRTEARSTEKRLNFRLPEHGGENDSTSPYALDSRTADLRAEPVTAGKRSSTGNADEYLLLASRTVGPRPRTVPAPLGRQDLEAIVSRVVSARAGRREVADGQQDGPAGAFRSREIPVADCLDLLSDLRDALFPLGIIPGGRAADDGVLGRGGQESRFGAGDGWRTVHSWQAVTDGLTAAGPGSSAFILARRPNGLGHAWAAYTITADPSSGSSGDAAVVWLDPQSSTPVAQASPRIPPTEARVVIVGADSGIVTSALPYQAPASTTTLVDPSPTRLYGAIGVEVEIPRWTVVLPRGERPDITYSNLMAESKTSRIVMENWDKGTPFIELVTDPLHALDGDEGRAPKEDFLAELVSLKQRLDNFSRTHPRGIRFTEIFSAEHGFSVRDDLQDILNRSILKPVVGRKEEIYPQYTVGVPTAGLYDLLLHVHDMTPSFATDLRQNITSGLRFGSEIATRYAEQFIDVLQGVRLPPQAADMLDWNEDVVSLRGFMALVYAQTAAEGLWSALMQHIKPESLAKTGGLPINKNLTPILSRTQLAAIRRDLSPAARKFLQNNVQHIRSRFTHHFEINAKNDVVSGKELRRIRNLNPLGESIEIRGLTLGDYFESALRSVDDVPNQAEMFGMHSSFAKMDTNRGNLELPVIPMELRFYGRSAQNPDEISLRFDVLHDLSRSMYSKALQLRNDDPADSTYQATHLRELARSDSPLAVSYFSFLQKAALLEATLPPGVIDGQLMRGDTVVSVADGVRYALRFQESAIPYPSAVPKIAAAQKSLDIVKRKLADLPDVDTAAPTLSAAALLSNGLIRIMRIAWAHQQPILRSPSA
ncbi:hypothetical protein ACFWBV_34870 [Streptomyces sp. NPDC060030]|uniref:hypothetical protein n=1 Tax=Streptomyces sp. NPDC060030 TaxID=3347042 RepID=UPI0036CEA38A